MQQEFKKEINKAEILVEALGYMQKYEGDIVVIKYGWCSGDGRYVQTFPVADQCQLRLGWSDGTYVSQ